MCQVQTRLDVTASGTKAARPGRITADNSPSFSGEPDKDRHGPLGQVTAQLAGASVWQFGCTI